MTEIQHRFLLVDDDEPTNVFHKYVLEKANPNAIVQVVNGGQSALDLLDEVQNSTPDVIFLDINMPLMSGWDVLENLQKLTQDRLPDRIVVFQSQAPTSKQEEILNSLNCEITLQKKPLTLDWVNNYLNNCNKSKNS